MTNQKILDRLFYRAAVHLTGRKDIQIRFRDPSVRGGDGFACLDKLERPVIEIRPDLSDERKLFVLLHECAHVKLHSKYWKANPNVDAFSGSIESPRGWWKNNPGLKAIGEARETEADELARKWLVYAHNREDEYGGETQLERLLKAATDWMDADDIYRRAMKTAERAGIMQAQKVIEFNKWKLEQLRLTRTNKSEFDS
jgi:hypothetical protein